MKPSKLEAFYSETFGARDPSHGEENAPPRRGAASRKARPRGGFGGRLLFRLCLMFAPMAILGIVAMTTDCGARPAGSILPEIVRSAACARRGLMGQATALEGTIRTVTDRLR